MDAESAAEAEAQRALAELRREEAGPLLSKEPGRPKNFVGLTQNELEIFQSPDARKRAALRDRLLKRIKRADLIITPLSDGTDLARLSVKQGADIAWVKLIDLLKDKSPSEVARLVSATMSEIAGRSPVDAAERVAAMVARWKVRATIPIQHIHRWHHRTTHRVSSRILRATLVPPLLIHSKDSRTLSTLSL